MSASNLEFELRGEEPREDAVCCSDFLFESSESLEHWTDESLDLLIVKFNEEDHGTHDRLLLFTELFETQTGAMLSNEELRYLTDKLSHAERYLAEARSKDMYTKLLPREIRTKLYESFMEQVKHGNKTAAFIDSRLVERAKQAIPMFYRYILLLLPEDDWPT